MIRGDLQPQVGAVLFTLQRTPSLSAQTCKGADYPAQFPRHLVHPALPEYFPYTLKPYLSGALEALGGNAFDFKHTVT